MEIRPYVLLLIGLFFMEIPSAKAGPLFQRSCVIFHDIKKKRVDEITADDEIKKRDVAAVYYIWKLAKEARNIHYSIGTTLRGDECAELENIFTGYLIDREFKLDLSHDDDLYTDRWPKISNLEPLKEFNQIKSLKLKGHQIEDLGPLFMLWNLIELDLSSNRLISESLLTLIKLPHLSKLSLANNNRLNREIFTYLNQIKLLKSLNLAENNLGSIFGSLTDLQFLTEIDISHSGLKNIDSVFKILNIKEIKASNNEVESLDIEALHDKSQIFSIDLDNNKLKEFTPYDSRPGGAPLKVSLRNNPLKLAPIQYQNIELVYDRTVAPRKPIQEIINNTDWRQAIIRISSFGSLKSYDLRQVSEFDPIIYAIYGSATTCNKENFGHIFAAFNEAKERLFLHKDELLGTIPLIAIARAYPSRDKQECLVMAQAMLENLGKQQLEIKDRFGYGALDYAVISRSIPLIKMFLQKEPRTEILQSAKLLAEHDKDIEHLINEALENRTPKDIEDIETELARINREAVEEARKLGGEKMARLFNAMCKKIENQEMCLRFLTANEHINSQRQVDLYQIINDFDRTPFLKGIDYETLRDHKSRKALHLYNQIQGEILNNFLITAMISENAFTLTDERVKPGRKEVFTRIASRLVGGIGKIFDPTCLSGIFSVGLDEVAKKMHDSKIKKVVDLSYKRGEIGDHNLFVQGEFAGKISLYLVKEIINNKAPHLGELSPSNFSNYGELARKSFVVTMFDEFITDNTDPDPISDRFETISIRMAKKIHRLILASADIRSQSAIWKKMSDRLESILPSDDGTKEFIFDLADQIKTILYPPK